MVSRTQEKFRERLRKRQNLIDKYDIVFDGPIPSREWPNTYAPIFQKLREIEDVQYEEYIRTLTSQGEINDYSGPISERVANLIRITYDYRNSWANESEWRNCEKIVLDRFHTDIPCNYCRKRRWIPYIQLEPLCAAAVEELRIKRSRTTLCRCRQVDRVGDQTFEKLQSPFSSRGNEPVLDDSVAEYGTKELGKHKPDYVIGLRQTTKLKRLLSSHPGIKDTPFTKKLSPSFPFLLLEAKPEAGPGFAYIEEQSAFPLRTLLNIQKNIPRAGDLTFDPLVWFMANQGDEWRVYACAPEGTKTRVIDLWHGTILREDNALQLLLIVDMICDWARDIYRKAVMKCLAYAIPDLRGVTPTDSLVSYNIRSGEETMEIDSDSSTSVENFINRDVIDLTSQDDSSLNERGNAINYSKSDVLTDVDTNALNYSDLDVSAQMPTSSDTSSDIDANSLEALMVSDVEMMDQGQDRENETAQSEKIFRIPSIPAPLASPAVAHGAVLRAANKEDGPERRVRSSFGILRTEHYEPSTVRAHRNVYPWYDPLDGEKYIRNTIDWVVNKGDLLPSGTVITRHTSHTFPVEPGIRFICMEILFISSKPHESHYRRTHPKNKGHEQAGHILVDMTFLKDNPGFCPVEPTPGGQGQIHYLVEFDLVIKINGRNLRFEARYPGGENGILRGARQISLAASFQPGTD